MTAPHDALPISDAEVEAACAEYDALGPATDRGLMRQALAAALAVRAQATELPPLPIGEAEVLWFDPQLRFEPEQAGKIIDASIAFMDAAPLGTKLYTVEQMRQYALDAQAVRAVPADFGGAGYGISAATTANFAANAAGTQSAYQTISAHVTRARTTGLRP